MAESDPSMIIPYFGINIPARGIFISYSCTSYSSPPPATARNQPRRTAMIDSRTAPYAALLLRLSLGTCSSPTDCSRYSSSPCPAPCSSSVRSACRRVVAYVTIRGRIGGGLLLLLGVGTRWVAACAGSRAAGCGMGASPATAGLFSAPKGGWEYPLFLTLAAAVQALLGDGACLRHGSSAAPAPRNCNPRKAWRPGCGRGARPPRPHRDWPAWLRQSPPANAADHIRPSSRHRRPVRRTNEQGTAP